MSQLLSAQNKDKQYLLKRFGQFGFIFFFLKGLLWIIVPLLAYFELTGS